MYDPCHIVPPHLLQAIADSEHNSEDVRKSARECLAVRQQMVTARQQRMAALAQPRGYQQGAAHVRRQQIIPEAMLNHLSTSENVEEAVRERAKRDLAHLQQVIARYQAAQGLKQSPACLLTL